MGVRLAVGKGSGDRQKARFGWYASAKAASRIDARQQGV